MKKAVAVLAGDGIGPEVMESALKVLRVIEARFGHEFVFKHAAIGGAAFERYKSHFPQETKEICLASDAILFGSVGGPLQDGHLDKWKDCEANSILALRKTFGFFANLRPIKVYDELSDISPLRRELIAEGVDILILRELLGDIYFGEHKFFEENGVRHASDSAHYNAEQISAIGKEAFKAARLRRRRVTSVDKANVLATSKLWRAVMHELSAEFPDIEYEDMLVDNCAMQLIRNPAQFDVIVTANLFGDILSDAAAVLPGSLGLTPSASLNVSGMGLYEPSGGSAPDIAGKGIANPTAQILSAAMMLRFSFGLEKEADIMEDAIRCAFRDGFRTADIRNEGTKSLGTADFTEKIISYINQ